ncbi:MAG: hypothetical protein P1P84_18130 [Deferrisomatales bacterium]|nr:hypothetical protein [Deferrisomatales bacterium]
MGKHICFVVHGVGKHGPGWATEAGGPVETLRAASRQYGYFQDRPLEEKVEFVPVRYDDVFDAAVTQWQGDMAAIQGLGLSGPAASLFSWLPASDAETRQFWWTHVADVALYRLTLIYRQRVRTRVLEQIAARIEAEDSPPRCSVLAHSMGTAVAHDCLHLLGTVRWGSLTNPLSPRHWRFEHLFMVANTSRLLQTDDAQMAKAYQSIVHPGGVEDPASYCASYWNFRHEADPVPFPRPFEPVGWKNYNTVLIRHYHDRNIHGFAHYLLNPRVHIPILRKLVHSRVVTTEEEVAAVNPDTFPMFGGRFAAVQEARELMGDLGSLQAELGDDPAFGDYLGVLVRYYRRVKEAL